MSVAIAAALFAQVAHLPSGSATTTPVQSLPPAVAITRFERSQPATLASASADRKTAAPAAVEVAPGEEVVVRARPRQSPDTEVRDFIRTVSDLDGVDPLARYSSAAVCPGVTGLGMVQNRAIAERMRKVALAAGVELDKPGCRANALLILAPDRKQMVATLRRDRPSLFQNARRGEVQVEDDGQHASAWRIEGYVDKWDSVIPASSDGPTFISLPDGASRLTAAVRPVIWFSAMVVDATAIDGLTVTQLADHAAMRLFTGANPARVNPAGPSTILTLLDTPVGGSAPVTMTAWDLSYLKALYAVPANRVGPSQRAAMKRRMLRDLREGSGPNAPRP